MFMDEQILTNKDVLIQHSKENSIRERNPIPITTLSLLI